MFSGLLSSWQKGQGHKYKRRIPYLDKRGRKRYRYFYADQHLHGTGTGSLQEMVTGAKFSLRHNDQPGHFEILAVEGGARLRLRHDESGAEITLSKKEFSRLLKLEHGEKIEEQKERFRARLREERKLGSISVKRTEKRAALLGIDVPRWESEAREGVIREIRYGAALPYRLALKNERGHVVRKWIKAATAEALILSGAESWGTPERAPQEKRSRGTIDGPSGPRPDLELLARHWAQGHQYAYDLPAQALESRAIERDQLYRLWVREKGRGAWRRGDSALSTGHQIQDQFPGHELLKLDERLSSRAPVRAVGEGFIDERTLLEQLIAQADQMGLELCVAPHHLNTLSESGATKEEISLSAERPPMIEGFDLSKLATVTTERTFTGRLGDRVRYTEERLDPDRSKRDPFLEDTGFYERVLRGGGDTAIRLIRKLQSGQESADSMISDVGGISREKIRQNYARLVVGFSDWWASLRDSERERFWSEYLLPESQPSMVRIRHPLHEQSAFSIPAGMGKFKEKGWDFHEYQRKAINFALQRERVLWGMEMGLGKTLCAIGLFEALREQGAPEKRMVVSAPLSAQGSWERELRENTDLRFEVISGKTKKKRREAYARLKRGEIDVLITSPQSLGTKKDFQELSEVIDQETLLIADEVHFFKSGPREHKHYYTGYYDEKAKEPGGSDQGIGFARLSEQAGRVVGMTGTPKPNRITDFFSVVTSIDPQSFPRTDEGTRDASLENFENDYCVLSESMENVGRGARGASHREDGRISLAFRPDRLEALHEHLAGSMFVRSVSDPDARIPLPDRIDLTPRIELDDLQQGIVERLPEMTQIKAEGESAIRDIELKRRGNREAIELYERVLRGEYGENDQDKKLNQYAIQGASTVEETIQIRLDQLMVHPGIFSEAFDQDYPDYVSPKMELICDAARDHMTENPELNVLLFCESVNGLRRTRDQMIARGVPPEQIAIYDGSTSPKKRREIEERFNSGELKVLLGNPQALATGANLQSRCNFVAHLNTPWAPDRLVQSTGRVYRQGQRHTTTILRPVGSEFDALKNKVIARKIAASSQALGVSMRAEADLVERAQSADMQALDMSVFQMIGINQEKLAANLNPEQIQEQREKDREQAEKELEGLKEADFDPKQYRAEIGGSGFPGATGKPALKRIQNGLKWYLGKFEDRPDDGARIAQRKGDLAIDDQGRVTAGDPFWAGVYAAAFADGGRL